MTLSRVLKIGEILDELPLLPNFLLFCTETLVNVTFWRPAVARDLRMSGQNFWPFAVAVTDVW